MSTERNSVGWFEIPVSDLKRAKTFYEHVFATTLQPLQMGPADMAMFPSDPGQAGAGGALIRTEGYTPSFEGSVVYFSVADIDGTLSRVTARGGTTVVPKMSIGEFGFIAQFKDSEGNRVALHSMN